MATCRSGAAAMEKMERERRQQAANNPHLFTLSPIDRLTGLTHDPTNTVSEIREAATHGKQTLQHFELHVLLAMLRERGETYSVPLVVALEKRMERPVAQAAVFIALGRLERKGLVDVPARRARRRARRGATFADQPGPRRR